MYFRTLEGLLTLRFAAFLAEKRGMKPFGFLVVIALILSQDANAQGIKLKGAKKHRHNVEPMAVDIDDVIRAEEDPNFAQYVKQREKDRQVDQAALQQHRKDQQAYRASVEKARQQYLKERKTYVPYEDTAEYKQHLKEQEIWDKQEEKNRQQYVRSEILTSRRLRAEQIARLQKAFPSKSFLPMSPSSERLPASIKK